MSQETFATIINMLKRNTFTVFFYVKLQTQIYKLICASKFGYFDELDKLARGLLNFFTSINPIQMGLFRVAHG